MALSTQQQMLIEQRVTNEAKSTGAAYLIWFILGGLGVHRFYLGRTISGLLLLCCTVLGAITLPIGIGLFFLFITGVWVLVDAFLIPGMVQSQKDAVRRRLTQDAMIGAGV
ncbi:Hypothetical protein BROD_1805 [Brucella sp. NF 2653]|uniref:TM2 domain-containing protein n=1 Tax=unclassified Brucella TaxID=2632610 RepID=UPI0001B47C03|nr:MULTISPECIES: TM2 domain-containing protein [unclassified Brucella]EEZ32904.1 conserved hypothetical protein [Brucella sp. 83/13]EFM62195.1 Hypothetical protein BROD_1805 [Brucella sp. NF 2653]